MNAEAFGALVFFCIVIGLGLLCFVICQIMNFFDKRADKKHHKEHPEYFRLRENFSEKANDVCCFYNIEIAPRKQKVDYILKEEPYWPQEVREKKMEELERLRREIYYAEDTYKYMNRAMENARLDVVEYVQAHGIKWAGVWE